MWGTTLQRIIVVPKLYQCATMVPKWYLRGTKVLLCCYMTLLYSTVLLHIITGLLYAITESIHDTSEFIELTDKYI